jgi:hypothetical protein
MPIENKGLMSLIFTFFDNRWTPSHALGFPASPLRGLPSHCLPMGGILKAPALRVVADSQLALAGFQAERPAAMPRM